MSIFFDYKLDDYDEEYYRIYERLDRIDFDKIPSFKKMKDMLSVRSQDKVLDAGSGDGHLLSYFVSGTGAEGYGIDFSSSAVDLAKKKYPDLDFSCQNIKSLDFEDNYFDKIVCYNVIEHIEGQKLVMKELNRILKPGGILVSGTIIKSSLCWKLYQLFIGEHTHVKEFDALEFRAFNNEFFEVKEHAVTSGVFRFSPPFVWLFHYVLKGDILVRSVK